MFEKRHWVRIEPAVNATWPVVAGAEAESSSNSSGTEISHGRRLIAVHHTGVQTQPLCTGSDFHDIFGHAPSGWELTHKIGTATIGRYRYANEVKPHQLMYGPRFFVPRVRRPSKYVSSGFQTKPFQECAGLIVTMRIQASDAVAKCGEEAEAAGFRVWHEVRNERVVHSERLHSDVPLDVPANLVGRLRAGAYVPNIYRSRVKSKYSPEDDSADNEDNNDDALTIVYYPRELKRPSTRDHGTSPGSDINISA